MLTFRVSLNRRPVDKVFYSDGAKVDAEEVRKSLVDHDGYDPGITVRREKPSDRIRSRLAYLRREIKAERISMEEVAELQSLAEHIPPGDLLLLEWAGVPENAERRS